MEKPNLIISLKLTDRYFVVLRQTSKYASQVSHLMQNGLANSHAITMKTVESFKILYSQLLEVK